MEGRLKVAVKRSPETPLDQRKDKTMNVVAPRNAQVTFDQLVRVRSDTTADQFVQVLKLLANLAEQQNRRISALEKYCNKLEKERLQTAYPIRR
jgi:hypothetical protein